MPRPFRTGACAAVVAGIRLGRLDRKVDVETRGGMLTIEWAGGAADAGPPQVGGSPLGGQRREERGGLFAPVMMTGPAVTVFEGEIEIPNSL